MNKCFRREIDAETSREVGNGKCVSDKQIRLKICSPHVLTMTLVDLPGIARVPVGDQPVDIESQIRDMVLRIIKHESCLILAVSPGNTDLAASDALTLAKMVDPEGRRTIGVITKLDIMDKGTSARNALLNEVVPLRLGYVGVVNRCQQDIHNKRKIREALASEAAFFANIHEYADLSDRCGTHVLSKKVSKLLAHHIAAVLPTLTEKVIIARNKAAEVRCILNLFVLCRC
jgi:dynamin 1-like protein